MFILTAGTLVIGGCAASIRPLRTLPRRVASGDTGSFTAAITAKNTITANSKPTGTTISLEETYSTSKQMTMLIKNWLIDSGAPVPIQAQFPR